VGYRVLVSRAKKNASGFKVPLAFGSDVSILEANGWIDKQS
jgi:hypothetical protein